MRTFKILSFAGLALLLFFLNTVHTGCRKPKEVVKTDTIAPPPPPLPPDTISLIRKLDVFTSLYPAYNIVPYRTYSFYYDNQKRLVTVGIKNRVSYLADTMTTRLEYTGNSKMPGRIIAPYLNLGSSSITGSYDTTWFSYTADEKILRDSTNELLYNSNTGGFNRKPMYRNYSYPDAVTKKVDWFWSRAVAYNAELMRRDTIRLNAAGRPDSIKAQYVQDPAYGLGSYAMAHGFSFSSFINPLAKLNISGTCVSLINTNVKNELLGNDSHPLVFGSNGFADYLDFISPNIPNIFYIGAFNKYYQMINSSAAAFSIEITAWPVRPAYPSEIKVAMSSSLAGDKYIYRYSY